MMFPIKHEYLNGLSLIEVLQLTDSVLINCTEFKQLLIIGIYFDCYRNGNIICLGTDFIKIWPVLLCLVTILCKPTVE